MLDQDDKQYIQETINNSIDRAINGVNQSINGVNASVDKVDKKIDEAVININQSVDKKIDDAVDGLNQSIDKKIDEAIDGLAENVLLPAFENIQSQFSEVKSEIAKRPTREEIQGKLDKMETRLTEDVTAKPLNRDRILNQKTDTVAHRLHDKDVFDMDDVKTVEKLSPFAVSPTLQSIKQEA